MSDPLPIVSRMETREEVVVVCGRCLRPVVRGALRCRHCSASLRHHPPVGIFSRQAMVGGELRLEIEVRPLQPAG